MDSFLRVLERYCSLSGMGDAEFVADKHQQGLDLMFPREGKKSDINGALEEFFQAFEASGTDDNLTAQTLMDIADTVRRMAGGDIREVMFILGMSFALSLSAITGMRTLAAIGQAFALAAEQGAEQGNDDTAGLAKSISAFKFALSLRESAESEDSEKGFQAYLFAFHRYMGIVSRYGSDAQKKELFQEIEKTLALPALEKHSAEKGRLMCTMALLWAEFGEAENNVIAAMFEQGAILLRKESQAGAFSYFCLAATHYVRSDQCEKARECLSIAKELKPYIEDFSTSKGPRELYLNAQKAVQSM